MDYQSLFSHQNIGIDLDNMQLIPYSEIKSENPGEVVALILKGPEKFGYCSPIPSNTKLTSFNIKDGIAFLTFSKDFMENTDESVFRPHFIVEILMKNLEQFNELKGIKISVENQQIKYINGYNFEDVFYFKPKESAIAEPQGVDPGDLNLVIDPGHGGTDPGAYNTEVSGSIYEKTATLDIGLKLRSYCGSLAKSIYMTRTTDETVGETLRESRINNSGGNLLISIHHNSTTNHTANGIETYYYDSADHYIADDVHIKAKEAYFGSTYGYFSDRGVKYGNYYVLRDTTVPGCLVEAGFISNTDHDYQIINSSSYRDEIAYHLYLGIRNYWLGY